MPVSVVLLLSRPILLCVVACLGIAYERPARKKECLVTHIDVEVTLLIACIIHHNSDGLQILDQ